MDRSGSVGDAAADGEDRLRGESGAWKMGRRGNENGWGVCGYCGGLFFRAEGRRSDGEKIKKGKGRAGLSVEGLCGFVRDGSSTG